jgi:hypothetical protein
VARHVLEELLVDPVRQPEQGQLAEGREVALPEEAAEGGVHPLRRVDVAPGEPAAQLLGRHVHQIDLVGGPDHRVGDGLPLHDPRNALDRIVERLQVLDVQRGQHGDARRHQLLHVLPALLVPAAGDVGVRQFVHHRYLRSAGKHGVDIHLFEPGVPVADLPPGHHLEAVQQRGCRQATVRLDEAHHHVLSPLLEAMRHSQHRVGLAHPGGVGEPDVQAAAPRPVDHVAPSMRQLCNRWGTTRSVTGPIPLGQPAGV